MVFKVLGLPAHSYEPLMDHIIDSIHVLVAYSFLLDTSLLSDLLRGEYLNTISSI